MLLMLNLSKLMIASQAGTCRKYVKLSCICKTQYALLLFFVVECSLFIWCVKMFQRNQPPLSSALVCHECGRSTSLQNNCVYRIETHGIKSHKTVSLFPSPSFIACNYLYDFIFQCHTSW